MSLKGMCPFCGAIIGSISELVPFHYDEKGVCPGTQQNPRNPESDRRILWNGKPNPHWGKLIDEPRETIGRLEEGKQSPETSSNGVE